MSDPLVSFLLPCRDAAGTLEAALRSLAGQSRADFEVVPVDDGSRDGTADLLEAWARRDPRVREPLSTGGRGLVPALNAAAAEARARATFERWADDEADEAAREAFA
ncbi:MAG: glycosyltransferase family 2 protein, partial [Gemmatimonadota bacterium]